MEKKVRKIPGVREPAYVVLKNHMLSLSLLIVEGMTLRLIKFHG